MEIVHLLGLSFLDSFQLGMILYTFIGIAGAYLLGKEWGGSLMGLVTAVACGYAPYHLVNQFQRGAIAEYLALGLALWTLWAFFNAGQRGRRRDVALGASFFALTTMTHNISGLWLAGLLLIYSVVIGWKSSDRHLAFSRLGIAYIGGLGLSAGYWIPALVEINTVHIERATSAIVHFDFHNHFQTLGEMFVLPHTVDLTQFGLTPTYPIGILHAALAILGCVMIIRHGEAWLRDDNQVTLKTLLFFVPVLLFLIFMMTRASTVIWETIPLLEFFQFPWRLINPTSILLSLLSGAGVTLLALKIRPDGWRGIFVGLVLLIMITYSLPWLYNEYLPEKEATSIVDAQEFERTSGYVGGTVLGEFIPVWTAEMPDKYGLADRYARSEVIPRLHPNPAVTIDTQRWRVLSTTLTITAHEDTRLIFDWLYWPGFTATLDSEPIPVTPTEPHGFVSIEAPMGVHTITINFGLTPLRRAAQWISMITAILMLLAMAGLRVWQPREARNPAPYPNALDLPDAAPAFIAALLIGLLTFTGKALVLDHVNTPIHQERFAHGLDSGLDYPVQANIDGKVILLGYDLPKAKIAADQPLSLVLYWELADSSIEEDISTNVVIRDSAGVIVHTQLEFYPADLPTSTWEPGYYVRDPLKIQLPAGSPPGAYTVQVGMYSHEMGRNLDILNDEGSPTGILIDLTTIEVTRPRHPTQTTDLTLSDQLDTQVTDELTLIHASGLPTEAEVGQQLDVVWYWRASHVPQPGLTAQLVWRDDSDQIVATAPPVPLVTGYPTQQWQQQDLWRGVHLVYVPGSLETGTYEVLVQLLSSAGHPIGNPAPIGRMEISTPLRTFAPPQEIKTVTDIVWENGIRLLGYDLEEPIAPDNKLKVTFYWQPEEVIQQYLTVFVHLYTDDGMIIAQRDQIPVDGTRPTTSWAPDEVVTDPYIMSLDEGLSPGVYRLRVGWYDALTGEQILTENGQPFFVLSQPILP